MNETESYEVEKEPSSLLASEPGLDDLIQQITSSATLSVGKLGSGIPLKAEQKLERIERKLDEYIAQYEERVLQELDPPQTASQVESLETKVKSMEKDLGAIRTNIDSEKSRQEQILRDFHATL